MRIDIAPLTHGFFVAPIRQRQNLSGLRQALEALDRNKAVDLGEQRSQMRGGVQIRAGLTGTRLRLENHGDHFVCSSRAARNVPSTLSTNVRSRIISRCACANAKLARPSESALMRARYASYEARLSN